ncbi:MAG: phosphate ABC transporter permease subunit PstC [Spirochaetaceae bacterium]|nr:phosphate ABC transporter permease subunit PstC [Spirochaetaceae bacterium]
MKQETVQWSTQQKRGRRGIAERKNIDIFFRVLFTLAALVSVLALGAILLFVFVQGAMPFFRPTASGIRLVPRNIDTLFVNGAQYGKSVPSIELPKHTRAVTLRFGGDGAEETLSFIAGAETGAAGEALVFTGSERGVVSRAERYVYSVSWPASDGTAEKRIHIILPEPPYAFFSFLGGLEWKPVRDRVFGIFPMIAGTLLTGLGAIILGVPAAILCALFLAEFLPPRFAAVPRAGIELLAGIPSVVYGFFGLMVIVPAARNLFGIPSGNTLFSAVLVLALMILPTVISIAETSLRAVPLAVREASLALGASKMQTAWRITLPHAHSGVAAGIILGISRAVGETMAVVLVAGNSPQLVKSPLESVRTLTATIAMEMGYASGRHSEMLFSIGVVLFSIILALNALLLRFRRRAEKSREIA